MAISIQKGLAARANDAFTFGLFEGALTHFHRNLAELIGNAVVPARVKAPGAP